jgi:CRISPR/Cas system-associated endonuclease Cas3-HD
MRSNDIGKLDGYYQSREGYPQLFSAEQVTITGCNCRTEEVYSDA